MEEKLKNIISKFLKSRCMRKYKRLSDGKIVYHLVVESDLIIKAQKIINRKGSKKR